jgi:RNase P protein component
MFPMIRPGFDLVFVIRSSSAARIDFHELQALLESLLRQAGLWNDTATECCNRSAAHMSEASAHPDNIKS